MNESSHDPNRYNVTLMDVERRLGFRVGRSGVERLEWANDDPGTPGTPKAVQPTLPKGDALQMYRTLKELVDLLDLSRRDVKFWKDKAFQEAEAKEEALASVQASTAQIQAVDAYTVKDSLASGG
jgi:hypothetical protein